MCSFPPVILSKPFSSEIVFLVLIYSHSLFFLRELMSKANFDVASFVSLSEMESTYFKKKIMQILSLIYKTNYILLFPGCCGENEQHGHRRRSTLNKFAPLHLFFHSFVLLFRCPFDLFLIQNDSIVEL